MSVNSIVSAKELLENHRSPTYGISAGQYEIIQDAIRTLDKKISDGNDPYDWITVSSCSYLFTPKMRKYIESLGYNLKEYIIRDHDSYGSDGYIDMRIPPSLATAHTMTTRSKSKSNSK